MRKRDTVLITSPSTNLSGNKLRHVLISAEHFFEAIFSFILGRLQGGANGYTITARCNY